MKENQHIEWKETWRDEFLRWICAFANAEGGVLHIGRNDKGVVVGLPDAARLLAEIPNKARDILGILVQVNLREEGGREYLEIVVEPYPYPISYKGEYHLRSGSTKQELRGATLDKFLLRKQGKHWDGVPLPGFSVAQCSAKAVQHFKDMGLRSGRLDASAQQDSVEAVLEKLQLTEGAYLKRSAALIFSDAPQRLFTGAYIKVGFFVTDDDLRYQDVIEGNLFEQVEKTLELVFFKYLKASIRYEGLQRIEAYPFPRAALREALLNAVVHKDYSAGIPIQISVYHDRLVLWNPGQLPPDWTLARLLGKHPSSPGNPLLANAFFLSGYIESWGRGIEKIARECQQHGIEPPVYDTGLSGLMLTFRASATYLSLLQAAATKEMPPKPSGKSSGESSGETDGLGDRLGDWLGNGLGDMSGKISGKTSGESSGETTGEILAQLQNNPKLTIPKLADHLGLTTRAVEKQIARLRKAGLLQRVGSTKSGRWQVTPPAP